MTIANSAIAKLFNIVSSSLRVAKDAKVFDGLISSTARQHRVFDLDHVCAGWRPTKPQPPSAHSPAPIMSPTTLRQQIRTKEPDRNTNQDWPNNYHKPLPRRAHIGKM